MSKVKPSLPSGTRDFGPDELRKRNYIFGIIRNVFEKYGYQPLETPAMENLSTLTGKYGEEGDKLLFRILNSGDFLKEVRSQKTEVSEENLKRITSMIAEKGLRYDLTIPFARYVVQHQNEITFPFKRYQIQPVWRADRPQKGRYREFYQCDADVIGSDSLLNEVELILIYDEVFRKLGLDVTIKINSRKILNGICEAYDISEKGRLIQILDKIDKINLGEIEAELASIRAGNFIKLVYDFNQVSQSTHQYLRNPKYIFNELESLFNSGQPIRSGPIFEGVKNYSANGLKGLSEIEYLIESVKIFGLHSPRIRPDISLVRGLDYYTGTIFEVKANNVQMGSIGGGGHYDNLTGVFGLPGVSGVGISFGVERIYDVMEELKLFDNIDLQSNTTRALFINFGGEAETKSFQYLQQLRANDIPAEIYPSNEKMKKQIGYADKKGIPYAIFVGEEELKNGLLQVKDLKTGEQKSFKVEDVIELIKRGNTGESTYAYEIF